MPYILLFTLTIAIATLTHSLAMILIFLIIVYILTHYQIWKFTRRDRGVYFSLVIVALLSVVVYDYRILGSVDALVSSYSGISIQQRLSGEEKFIVTQRERAGRYTIENIIDRDPETSHKGISLHVSSGGHVKQVGNQDFLLYTSQSLRPGDIILTKREPLWRDYYPEFCILICRQSGQVLDTTPPNPPLVKGGETKFDYDRWLYMQGLDGSLYDNNVFVSDHQDLGGLVSVRESFFQRVVGRFGMTDPVKQGRDPEMNSGGQQNIHAGLMPGMTIGDRSLIDPARYDQFISSGLVHLIAVSGGNIAIVVLFIGMLLFWVPFYIRQVILIGAIISYAMIVGDDSSVIRATVMGLLTLIVLFPGRQLSIWRSIAYARCGMLLRDPYYLLYDMGFILSFSAVIGIVWAEKVMGGYKQDLLFSCIRGSQRNKKTLPTLPLREDSCPKPIESMTKDYERITNKVGALLYRGVSVFITLYIVPTFGAMVGVTPWLLYLMDTTNLLSPMVNIAIVPLVPLITIGSFISPYLPVWTGGDTLIIWCMDYIGWLSMIGTQYGIYLSLAYWSKIVLLCMMLLYWVYWIDRQVSNKEISE